MIETLTVLTSRYMTSLTDGVIIISDMDLIATSGTVGTTTINLRGATNGIGVWEDLITSVGYTAPTMVDMAGVIGTGNIMIGCTVAISIIIARILDRRFNRDQDYLELHSQEKDPILQESVTKDLQE
tara:strand:+ start:290 stop:670 length:381 start_codon:yes stop_codon:yes gene_type:complete